MLIALYGGQGAGKDTVANILIQYHGFIKLSFAQVLKDAVATIFSWPRDLLEGDTEYSREWREIIDPYWAEKTGIHDFSPRKALQYIGTDLFRNHFCQDIWLHILEKKYLEIKKAQPNAKFVITDCRFANEYKMLQNLDCIFIKINRENQTIHCTHCSEQDWHKFTYFSCIDNNGSIADLHTQVKFLMINLK
jgi:hypothetical protein